MVDLESEARALLEGYRRARTPPAGLRARVELRVAQRAQQQQQQRRRSVVIAGCVGVGAVAAALVIAIRVTDGRPRLADPVAGIGTMAADQPPTRATGVTQQTRPPASAVTRPPAAPLANETASGSPPANIGPPVPPTRAIRGVRSGARPQPDDVVAESQASLLLLRKAQQDLASDPRQSLQYLEQYQRRFGLQHAAHEWRALRVLALCAIGKQLQGRGEGAALMKAHPSSPYADRIAQACRDPEQIP